MIFISLFSTQVTVRLPNLYIQRFRELKYETQRYCARLQMKYRQLYQHSPEGASDDADILYLFARCLWVNYRATFNQWQHIVCMYLCMCELRTDRSSTSTILHCAWKNLPCECFQKNMSDSLCLNFVTSVMNKRLS